MEWNRQIWRSWMMMIFLLSTSPLIMQAETVPSAAPVATTVPATIAPAAAYVSSPIDQQATALCSTCHGVLGNNTTPTWPKIAGLDRDYALKQLRAFKQTQNRYRDNPLMTATLANLTDDDLIHLAAYYAHQSPSTGTAEPTNLALGARLYRAGDKVRHIPACLACHGPQGHGLSSAQTPRISGQHAAYLASQLQAYRSGKRCTDPNQMMRMIAERLTDDEIQALANYIQGLYLEGNYHGKDRI